MINRYGIYLRLVEESDAEFILTLRTNSELSTYISFTNPSISDQVEWIQRYKIREQLGLEFYFIALDQNGNKCGTIRLYNFDENSFELGSWVFKPKSPFGIAVKTHLSALETGFELLNADYCKITVRKKNTGVVRYLNVFHPIKIKEDDLDYFFHIPRENVYNYTKDWLFSSKK